MCGGRAKRRLNRRLMIKIEKLNKKICFEKLINSSCGSVKVDTWEGLHRQRKRKGMDVNKMDGGVIEKAARQMIKWMNEY